MTWSLSLSLYYYLLLSLSNFLFSRKKQTNKRQNEVKKITHIFHVRVHYFCLIFRFWAHPSRVIVTFIVKVLVRRSVKGLFMNESHFNRKFTKIELNEGFFLSKIGYANMEFRTKSELERVITLKNPHLTDTTTSPNRYVVSLFTSKLALYPFFTEIFLIHFPMMSHFNHFSVCNGVTFLLFFYCECWSCRYFCRRLCNTKQKSKQLIKSLKKAHP